MPTGSRRMHADVDDAVSAFNQVSLGGRLEVTDSRTNPVSSLRSQQRVGGQRAISQAQLSASRRRGRNEVPVTQRASGIVPGGGRSGYNLDNLDALEAADIASASTFEAHGGHNPLQSPPVPGMGRSSYNLDFVDYENESTDGEGGYESDNVEDDWDAFWEGRLDEDQIDELTCNIVLKGGAELDQIKNLPTLTYGDLEAGCANAECSVCLDEFKNADLVNALPCGHHFHLTCIRRAMKVNNKCPYCRFEMPRTRMYTRCAFQYNEYEDDLFD
mmetsp:Transcript_17712/g.38642  ORF Transcript_17712/g.38642 Transcript_17712/m.38642 type:complete len:273 (+) Transcript_17712:257-1075(+)